MKWSLCNWGECSLFSFWSSKPTLLKAATTWPVTGSHWHGTPSKLHNGPNGRPNGPSSSWVASKLGKWQMLHQSWLKKVKMMENVHKNTFGWQISNQSPFQFRQASWLPWLWWFHLQKCIPTESTSGFEWSQHPLIWTWFALWSKPMHLFYFYALFNFTILHNTSYLSLFSLHIFAKPLMILCFPHVSRTPPRRPLALRLCLAHAVLHEGRNQLALGREPLHLCKIVVSTRLGCFVQLQNRSKNN